MDNPLRPEASPVASRILAIDDEIATLERTRPKPYVVFFGSVVFPLGIVAVAAASFALDFPELRRVAALLAVPCLLYARQLLGGNARRSRLERELDELIDSPRRGEPGAGR
jgi:hypothetical protein